MSFLHAAWKRRSGNDSLSANGTTGGANSRGWTSFLLHRSRSDFAPRPVNFRERISANQGVAMRLLNKAIVISLLMGLCAAADQAQERGTAFPSDADINLVVLQADSVMDQYRAAAGQEETVLGAGADAVSREKQLLGSWNFTLKGLQVKPQTFNGELGLEFVLMLDDAARNTALCSAVASLNSAGAGLAKSCADASAHLHTVSQSVSVLYRQYVTAEQERAGKACPEGR
jgi:hypothetical protein